MRFFGSKLGCAAGVVCMLAASSAKANIVFCNEFPAEVWVAIAYQQEDGSWLSRGWLSVEATVRGMKLRFINTTSNPVITNGKPTTVDIRVSPLP